MDAAPPSTGPHWLLPGALSDGQRQHLQAAVCPLSAATGGPPVLVHGNASPAPGAPWGVAALCHPRQGHLLGPLATGDVGLGCTLWHLQTDDPGAAWRRREQQLAQTLFEALVRPKHVGSRFVLGAAQVQQLFTSGAAALRNLGVHDLPTRQLPHGGVHPQSDAQDLAPEVLNTYGRRMGTLGRGNQWAMLLQVHEFPTPPAQSTGLAPWDLVLAVQAGSRGVGTLPPDTGLVALDTPRAEALLRHLGTAWTFALCNRLTLSRLAVDAVKSIVPATPRFLMDIPFHTVAYEDHAPPGGTRQRWLTHRKGLSNGPSLLRGPLDEPCHLMLPAEGAPSLLPVDGGFHDTTPPKAPATGGIHTRWLLASDPKNTTTDAKGFRRPALPLVRALQDESLATVGAVLEPLVVIYA